MSFVNYVEPEDLDSGIAVGLGEDNKDGREYVSLYIKGAPPEVSVLLDCEQAADLISALARALGALGIRA